jgi:N-acetylglucosaminyl-diphospho-decaprenol L-rhamnosyltransferase
VGDMALVDIVVVSYNSRVALREAVERFAGIASLNVIVVDNASKDGSLATVEDLPITRLAMPYNGGFAFGCNAGWRAGRARYVLFMNPDAALGRGELDRLVSALENHPAVGLIAPRIEDADGGLEYSLRRFPRLRSTFAQALFLHRVFPQAPWVDEVIRDPARYDRPGPAEWVSGACMLVRRDVLERVDGLDEEFFMYCEDVDLCRRIWAAGYEVRYDPDATAVHLGGASAPRASLLPRLAASRIRYAQKHRSPVGAVVERIGIGVGELTHAIVSAGGPAVRLGHARALRLVLSRSPTT